MSETTQNNTKIVNKPTHYTDGKIEVIDFITDKNLDFSLGNTIKYIARAGKKDPGKYVEDLFKAAWYLNHKLLEIGAKGDPTITGMVCDQMEAEIETLNKHVNTLVQLPVSSSQETCEYTCLTACGSPTPTNTNYIKGCKMNISHILKAIFAGLVFGSSAYVIIAGLKNEITNKGE